MCSYVHIAICNIFEGNREQRGYCRALKPCAGVTEQMDLKLVNVEMLGETILWKRYCLWHSPDIKRTVAFFIHVVLQVKPMQYFRC